MKILHINSGNFGSTGNIMVNLAKVAREKGHTVYTACPDSRTARLKELKNHIYIGNRYERNMHLQLGKVTGMNGCYSKHGTREFLDKVDKLQADIIHLHNLHNCFINLAILFDYIKQNETKVVWTLHDCWAFTGQCPHFTAANCDKWKTHCFTCPQYKKYPKSWVDRTQKMYHLKKSWFTGVKNLTIVTPSQWLADTTRESFLSCYPVRVINNGIDLDMFKPTPSDFRQRHQLHNKIVLLGVADGWGARKGLDILLELPRLLDEKYKLVLVGLSKQQIQQMPKDIIGLPRTRNQRELAEIYSAADLFVNPSREDNFPTTNLEALACGTPVITFDTGGSPECIDYGCGTIVHNHSSHAFADSIRESTNCFENVNSINRAKRFDMWKRFEDYLELYDSIMRTG